MVESGELCQRVGKRTMYQIIFFTYLHTTKKQNTIKVYQGTKLYPTHMHPATNFFYWGKKQDWGLSSASLAK